MNRMEKFVMDRWRRNAALIGMFGILALGLGVSFWVLPTEEGFPVIANIILTLVLVGGGLLCIALSYYGTYSVGVVQGRKGWDESGEAESFDEQVGKERIKLEEKLR